MNPVPNRLVVYVKDIAHITGQSLRTARRLMKKIRTTYNRANRSFVSVQDLCAFTGLPEDKVLAFLN